MTRAAAGSCRLLLLYRGVYAVGPRPVGVRSREMAVALMAGVRAVGRHSALAMWAMSRPWHGPVHALGPKARSGPGYVIHRTRHLPPEDVTVHWGIPTTTALRTLLDLSSQLSLDVLDAALAEALVRKLVRLEEVQARATGTLARLVSTAAPTKSRLERDIVLATAGHRTVRLTAAQLARRATVAERFTALLTQSR